MSKVNLKDPLELFFTKVELKKIVEARRLQIEGISVLEFIFLRDFTKVLDCFLILFLHKKTMSVHDVTLGVVWIE